MSDPFYVARTRVVKVRGVHRRAEVEAGVTLELGVHGPVKRYYGLDDEPDLPLPVDYVVASAVG